MLDVYYQGSVSHISPEAPVPVLKKTDMEKYVPGGACNVAMNLKSAGDEVSVFGVLGNDRNGDRLIEVLDDSGIDTTYISRINIDTISKIRFLSNSNQQLLRMDVENIEDIKDKVDYAHLLSELTNVVVQYDMIVISDYLNTIIQVFTDIIILTVNRPLPIEVQNQAV